VVCGTVFQPPQYGPLPDCCSTKCRLERWFAQPSSSAVAVNTCGHPERRHYAKDRCRSCYQRDFRQPYLRDWKRANPMRYKATCEHRRRRAHIGGLCEPCYQKTQTPVCHPERPYHKAGLCASCYKARPTAPRATCHPDKPRVVADGRCMSCFDRDRRAALSPETKREANVATYRKRTRKPLTGPVTEYAGELTYLDCPHCGETELINVDDRPLTCQICGERAKVKDIWLFVPPLAHPKQAQYSRDYAARLRATDPARYKAKHDRGNAQAKARREAMERRVRWLTWEEVA
jgi:hypothetical protein